MDDVEGIRVSAQVDFFSQLGANVRCSNIVTMNFVKETLPNLIIRPLLDPYRYKHTSRRGFCRRVMNTQSCSTLTMNDSSHFVSLNAWHWEVVVTEWKVW